MPLGDTAYRGVIRKASAFAVVPCDPERHG